MAKTVAAASQVAIAAVSDAVDTISVFNRLVKSGNELVLTIKGLVENMTSTVDNAISIYAFLKKEETRNIEECTAAVKQVCEAVEYACNVVRYVDDLTHYGGGQAMQEAEDGLKKKRSNFKPLDDILGLLERTLEKVSKSYETFKSVSEMAGATCAAAAMKCNEKARDEARRRTTVQAVGGTVAGMAMVAGIGTGVTLSAIAGVFTFGIGTVVGLSLTAAGAGVTGLAVGTGTAVATHYIASSYGDTEKLFSMISESFGNLQKYSIAFHQNCVGIKNGIDHTKGLMDDLKSHRENDCSIAMITDIFNRLCNVFKGHQKETTQLKEQLNRKKEELQKLMEDQQE